MNLAGYAEGFASSERPAGNMLDARGVLAQAIAATRFYAGYSDLTTPTDDISGYTDITLSEWALIRPLFLLYLERETSLQLEASHAFGVESFGRASSEVAGDIPQMEIEFPRRAFCQEVRTV